MIVELNPEILNKYNANNNSKYAYYQEGFLHPLYYLYNVMHLDCFRNKKIYHLIEAVYKSINRLKGGVDCYAES